MFIIDGTKIKLTKGDTATMKLEVFDLNNNLYPIKETDTVVMTVKQSSGSAAVITKQLTSDCYFVIDHSDTANLANGLYVYDVLITTQEGNVYTVIPTSFFEICEEIS